MNSVKNADDDLKVDTGDIVETIAKNVCLRKVPRVREILLVGETLCMCKGGTGLFCVYCSLKLLCVIRHTSNSFFG
jgi:hypothetical protein